jgi:nucleotide-binding universal stress UspA family protein
VVVRLVAAVDVDEGGAAVVEHAIAWARRFRATLDLAFASEWSTEGLPPPTAPTDELDELWVAWQERAAEERRQLVALQAAVPEDVRGAERFVTGRPVEALPDLAAQYDLMIVASHARKGLERILLGSVTSRLVRHVRTPTLVVGLGDPPPASTGRIKVLAPLDEREDGALPWLAKRLPDEPVEVVHVLPPDRWLPRALLGEPGQPSDPAVRRQAVEQGLRARAAAFGFPGAAITLVHRDTGNPGDAIARIADREDADVVVLPTHTRTTFEHWFVGSVAERVVERAPCPVLVVPKGAPVG